MPSESFGGIGSNASQNQPSLLPNDILAIKTYLATRGDINMINLGYVGYSMGGGAGFELLFHDNDFKAMVGLAPVPDFSHTNVTNPRNLLVVVGQNDEAIMPEYPLVLDVLAYKTGLLPSEIQPGYVYGNFALGTAAELIIFPAADHLSAPYDFNFVRAIRDWNLEALQGVPPSALPADFAYPILIISALVSIVGAVGLFWASSGSLLARFARKSADTPPSAPILNKLKARPLLTHYFSYGLLLAVPGMLVGLPLLLVPQAFSDLFVMFLIGPSMGLLVLAWRMYKKQGISFVQMYRMNLGITSRRNIGVGVGLGILLYALLYLSVGSILGIAPGVFPLAVASPVYGLHIAATGECSLLHKGMRGLGLNSAP